MKKILFLAAFVFYIMAFALTANAAGAKLSGDVVKNIKTGTVISGSKIVINMNGNEVSHFKDSISITLDGANWNLPENGTINNSVTYNKTSENVIKLNINVTEDMAKSGYSLEVPVDCTVSKVKASIVATINYGFSDISENKVTIATGSVSRASTNKVREVQTGDKFYKKNSDTTYSKLSIFITPNDAEKVVRNSVVVTFDGFKITDYADYGKVSCDRGSVATYARYSDATGLEIRFDTFNAEMKVKGFTLTLPLTGTVTGDGNIKANIQFPNTDMDDMEVIFAKVSGGNSVVTVQVEEPVASIDTANKVSSVIINDNTLNNYNSGTK
ncbi:MAG: hypothetical protein ACI4VF_00890, partial [Lachnospirales bacterium]